MRDHQRDVDSEAVLQQPPSLGSEISAATSVGINEDSRDALGEKRSRAAELAPGERAAGVRVRVDEARGYIQTLDVDDSGRGCSAKVANGGDPISADSHVSQHPRVAGAVENPTVPKEKVECSTGSGRACSGWRRCGLG
jgi:hypothetical protein